MSAVNQIDGHRNASVALPSVIILLFSPDYLNPLFETLVGNIIFGIAVGLILMAMWIVSQMIKIDI